MVQCQTAGMTALLVLGVILGAQAATAEYGIVIDAGSSGTRIRVYRWAPRLDRYSLPEIREIYSSKAKPGISAFADNLGGLKDYLRPLIEKAQDEVPDSLQRYTSIYLMATAGMRLLLEPRANAVMEELDTILSDSDVNPFLYNHLNTRILSGEEEGVFAWIAVNYLAGYFDDPDEESSAGVLELGGASTQIVFRPRGSILADKFPVKIAGRTYPLYVHSYLYYGQNFVVTWIQEQLQADHPGQETIDNPCMLKGDEEIRGAVRFRGSGDPEACLVYIDKLVYKIDDWRCHPKPCAIGAVYQPSISPQHPFYAVSAFVFPLQTLEVLNPDGSFSPDETRESALTFCGEHLNVIKNRTGKPGDFLSTECLMGLYLSVLFTKGYGFTPDTSQLYAAKNIEGNPAEWALGAIIYENERKDWVCEENPRTGASISGTGPVMATLPQGTTLLLTLTLYLLYSPSRILTSG